MSNLFNREGRGERIEQDINDTIHRRFKACVIVVHSGMAVSIHGVKMSGKDAETEKALLFWADKLIEKSLKHLDRVPIVGIPKCSDDDTKFTAWITKDTLKRFKEAVTLDRGGLTKTQGSRKISMFKEELEKALLYHADKILYENENERKKCEDSRRIR